ncbi:TBC1 domain family member 31-like [Sycon ciliatum]|uniref:TBC1 domain family member 31-like n=1 Tax=Sycon ciliatum TaxID=27933 RepID=UPI0031F6185E
MSKRKPAVLDLTGKSDGNLWTCKPSASAEDGLLAHIMHRHATTSSTLHGRAIRFNRVAFCHTSNKLAAADQLGNVFLITLRHNRFSLLRRLGVACTALEFATVSSCELYVALSDGAVHCLNWKSGELVATLRGHSSSVRYISSHTDGRFFMTTSSAEAILWDAKTHQRLRTLNGAQGVGVQQALFLPISNTLITCFKDDSIFAWTIDSLQYQYRLVVHDGPAPKFRALAASSDGRFLVAGGRSQFLHVWALDTRRLARVIELPSAVRRVEHLFFIKDNCEGGVSQSIGVVCQDGITRFLRIDTCRLLFELGVCNSSGQSATTSTSQAQVESMIHSTVSADGRYVASVSDTGSVQLFNVETVCPQLSQPPAPLVRTLVADSKPGRAVGKKPASKAPVSIRKPALASTPSKHSGVACTASDTGDETAAGEDSVVVPSPSQSGTGNGHSIVADDSEAAAVGEMAVDVTKLYSILRGYGRYPEKYRLFIWRSVLRLPENHAAYASLCNRGTHVAFQDIQEKYPVKSRKLLRQLQRTLSALAHWSPIFGEVTFLAPLIFPFIKLFSNNRLLAFEMCATLLLNYTQHWFDFHPHLPVGVLGMVESVLAHHDIGLIRHFTKNNITSAGYAWPLLETMLSEVLTREEWLYGMDNVLSNPPHYLLFLVISYLIACRQTLLRCKSKDFDFFFKHRNAIDIGQVVKEAYRLSESTPCDIHPQSEYKACEPLTKGQYPVFSDYPKYAVDYQRQERDRIRQEELELLRERQATIAAHQSKTQHHRDEETFQRHQQMLAEAEQEQLAQLEEEDRKLHEQRMRLLALKREVQASDMVAMDATRRRLMEQQVAQREAELKRLDAQVDRKARLRHEETQLAVEAAQVQSAEMELQKAMLEAEMSSQHQAADTALKHAWAQHEHDTALHTGTSAAQQTILDTRRKQQKQVFEAQQRLARLQQQNAAQHGKAEVQFRARIDTLEQELEQLQVDRQKLLNQGHADKLSQTLHGAELRERHQQQTTGNTSATGQASAGGAHTRAAQQPRAPLATVNLTDSPPASDLSMSSLSPSDTDPADTSAMFSRRPKAAHDEEQLLREVTNLRRRVAKRLQDGSRALGLSDTN